MLWIVFSFFSARGDGVIDDWSVVQFWSYVCIIIYYIVLYDSGVFKFASQLFAAIVLSMLSLWLQSAFSLSMWGLHVSVRSKVSPSNSIENVSFSICFLLSISLIFGRRRLQVIISARELKPEMSDHFCSLSRISWSNVCMVWGFVPLQIRIKSSAYKNPLIGFVTVFKISFMVIRNRDMLRTVSRGTPISRALRTERALLALIWIDLVVRKLIIKLKGTRSNSVQDIYRILIMYNWCEDGLKDVCSEWNGCRIWSWMTIIWVVLENRLGNYKLVD